MSGGMVCVLPLDLRTCVRVCPHTCH